MPAASRWLVGSSSSSTSARSAMRHASRTRYRSPTLSWSEPTVRVARGAEPRQRLVDAAVGVPRREVLVPGDAPRSGARGRRSRGRTRRWPPRARPAAARTPAERLARRACRRWRRRATSSSCSTDGQRARCGAPSPDCGASSPARTRSSVVLPAPFSPTTPDAVAGARPSGPTRVEHRAARVAEGHGVGDAAGRRRGARRTAGHPPQHPHERRDERAERLPAVADRVLLLGRQLRARPRLARRARGPGRSRSRRRRAARSRACPRSVPVSTCSNPSGVTSAAAHTKRAPRCAAGTSASCASSSARFAASSPCRPAQRAEKMPGAPPSTSTRRPGVVRDRGQARWPRRAPAP